MARIKGTDTVMLRKFVRNKGSQFEEKIIAKLSNEAKETYLNTISISWLPVEIHSEIYQAAADVLYPNEENRAYELGLEIARQTYSGLYKIFLTIPSLQFIVKRAASLWKTYYNVGKATVDNVTSSTLDFIVTEFPSWPRVMRDATNAHITYLAQTAGKKEINIRRVDSNRDKWVWHISWKEE